MGVPGSVGRPGFQFLGEVIDYLFRAFLDSRCVPVLGFWYIGWAYCLCFL